MENTMKVICLTDLKSSTELTEKLGNEGVRTVRGEHLRLGKLLAQHRNGRYIKNIGDAHLIEFDGLESALTFSAMLQQYYLPLPCIERIDLQVRIGLFLGVVEPTSDDVFGSGVNQAARVEGKATPGEIWVNKLLVDAMRSVWGDTKVGLYFKSQGEHELKGISNPPKQELFSFDWDTYSKEKIENGLCKLVKEHLSEASIVASNISDLDYTKSSSIIWPVVPRDKVNAIHRGQIEIIRLLTILGWKVHILIADCGVKDNPTKEYSEKFKNLVEKYLTGRKIKNIKYHFMSELFRPGSDDCHNIHKYFQKVITDFTLNDLLNINHKEYSPEVKDKLRSSAALDFLRPALTIAAVLQISEKIGEKTIVIAGLDEKIQWERSHSIPGCPQQFGVLFNPKLITGQWLGQQTKDWPVWYSWEAMVDLMNDDSNLSQWTIQMHAYLPEFPAKELVIDGVTLTSADWASKDVLEKKISKDKIAKHVYNKILSN